MRTWNLLPREEPFRLLLPLGLAAGVSGASLWIFHLLQSKEASVRLPHAQVMMGSFVFCFVAGYLLTFLPRLAGTRAATPRDTLIISVLALGSGLSALAELEKLSFLMSFLGLGWLIWFCRTRIFASSRRHFPASFLYVGLGLGSGWLGAFLLCLPIPVLPDDPVLVLARRLYFQAMFLFLVLGEGTRVFPLLCGRERLAHPTLKEAISVSSVILAGYGFEFLDSLILGGFLKATGPTWVAVRSWGLLAPLGVSSPLALGLLISAPLFLAGFWMVWLLPGSAVMWMHLSYIGGFSLMSLMIATRQTLVQGRYDLALEATGPGLTWVIGSLGLATFFRVIGPLFAPESAGFMGVAAFFWIAGVSTWSVLYLVELIDPKEKPEALASGSLSQKKSA